MSPRLVRKTLDGCWSSRLCSYTEVFAPEWQQTENTVMGYISLMMDT